MKKFTFMTSIIVAFCMMFTSCGFVVINHKDQPDDTAAPQKNEIIPLDTSYYDDLALATARVNSLPDFAFEKSVFTLACDTGYKFIPEEIATDYDTALVHRKEIVEDKYGVSVLGMNASCDLMLSDGYNAYLAGTYYCDAMLIPTYKIGEFASRNFLTKTNSIPGINYDAEWYDKDTMNKMSAGAQSYAIYGYMTDYMEYYYCIYANTGLIEKLGLDVPYDEVSGGSWTWDKMIEITRAASDIDSSISFVAAQDSANLLNAVYKSSGGDFVSAGLGNTPQVAFNNDSMSETIRVIRSLCGTGKALYGSTLQTGNAIDDFTQGNVLFYMGTIAQMTGICKAGSDWTVLPSPKFNAEDKNYTCYASSRMPCVVVPANSSDIECTATVLTALNAGSGKYIKGGYYDYLTLHAINKSKTLDMLDYICGIKSGKPNLDFVDGYSGMWGSLTSVRDSVWDAISGTTDINGATASASKAISYEMGKAFTLN